MERRKKKRVVFNQAMEEPQTHRNLIGKYLRPRTRKIFERNFLWTPLRPWQTTDKTQSCPDRNLSEQIKFSESFPCWKYHSVFPIDTSATRVHCEQVLKCILLICRFFTNVAIRRDQRASSQFWFGPLIDSNESAVRSILPRKTQNVWLLCVKITRNSERNKIVRAKWLPHNVISNSQTIAFHI